MKRKNKKTKVGLEKSKRSLSSLNKWSFWFMTCVSVLLLLNVYALVFVEKNFLAGVWCLMTIFWMMLFTFSSRSYAKHTDGGFALMDAMSNLIDEIMKSLGKAVALCETLKNEILKRDVQIAEAKAKGFIPTVVEEPVAPVSPTVISEVGFFPPKRGRGRPKGSKNKVVEEN